jgi:multiple sugar transport system substrate-binding protein
VIGAENPQHYWFDPDTMEPLIASPGHVRALEMMVDLVQFGPRGMLDWDLSQSWDYFLRGEAALTFTWGDLGPLTQQEGSMVKGKLGTAHLPGTTRYYNIPQAIWVDTDAVNTVGNTTGGSWAGVISRDSDAPEATYYLLALLATPAKSLTYVVRGWDGIDIGRSSHFLPPNGSADIDAYLNAGWQETDIRQYSEAYYNNFSNARQLPYLRIPGTFGYWSALDIHLFEAVSGQLTPAQALAETALDFEELTDLLGREQQIELYRASLNMTAEP